MINLKILIFLDNQPSLSCIQIVTQPHKTLQQLGNFLYNQQKIDFNDFLFINKPVKNQTINQKKPTHKEFLKNKVNTMQKEQKQGLYMIFTNQEMIQNILVHLKEQKQSHYLLLMYSKKDFDEILKKDQSLHSSKDITQTQLKKPKEKQVIPGSNECYIF